ncbi:MAG TPA: single-stranded-DNA-specific exonuclease RecJ [Kofleriaceae bacterium]|nr:single-stranded-DNA-specific exonuclease RecJ [Kofleriaceae bacterium]
MLSVRSLDDALVSRLARELQLLPTTSRCLVARGMTEVEAARGFLSPKLGGLRKPDGMAGFTVAADRVMAAVLRGERVAVFGDYDVDGVTTCALLTCFLRGVGADVVSRVARRDEGYGFCAAAAADVLAREPRLIIIGDCGTSDGEVIATVRARGVDVVVVDHHTVPAAGEVHPALALVNPYRADSSFPFRGMASVGIAFYLAAAVRTRLREQGWFRSHPEVDPRELLDLVALGTIADLVPLSGENRILTAAGLKLLAERKRPGLASLLGAAGMEEGGEKPIDEKTVSWKLAPRLNAPGRLGDAAPALELLLAGGDEASACAQALEASNQKRRELQDRMVEEALAMVDGAADTGPAVVVASDRWAPGVVGIVAAKLVDRYQKPAFVLAIDPKTGLARGSARSVGGVDLYRALGQCAPMLERWGGHAAAAGLTVRAADGDMDATIGRLREALGAAVLADGSGKVADVHADAEIELGLVDERLADELGGLAPFGQENPPPLLVARGLEVRSTRKVGADGSHLKLEVRCPSTGASRGAIAFGQGGDDPGEGARIDVAFTPSKSTWNGKTRVELEVKRIRPVVDHRA